MKTVLVFTLFYALILSSFAQTNKRANEKFNEGYKAYNNGQYETACRKFLETREILGVANDVVQPYLVRTLIVVKNWPRAKTELEDYFDLPGIDSNKHYSEMQGLKLRIRQALDDEDEFFRLAKKDLISNYAAYQKKYPYGRYEKEFIEAQNIADEKQDWREAQAANKPGTYEKYLKKYPSSGHSREAQQLLDNLDEKAWQNAKKINSYESYYDYIDEFSRPLHFSEAKIKRDEREDEEAYQDVLKLNTTLGYKIYLEELPNGKFTTQVKILLERAFINEGDAEMVLKKYSTAKLCYDSSLTRFPNGAAASEALRKKKLAERKIANAVRDDFTTVGLQIDGHGCVGMYMGTTNGNALGGYFSFRFNENAFESSDEEFMIDKNGYSSESLYNLEHIKGQDDEYESRFDMTGGITYPVLWPIYIYSGLGVGIYPTLWKVRQYNTSHDYIGTETIANSEYSHLDFALEGGLMVNLGNFNMRGGIFSNFRESYFTVGIGAAFDR